MQMKHLQFTAWGFSTLLWNKHQHNNDHKIHELNTTLSWISVVLESCSLIFTMMSIPRGTPRLTMSRLQFPPGLFWLRKSLGVIQASCVRIHFPQVSKTQEESVGVMENHITPQRSSALTPDCSEGGDYISITAATLLIALLGFFVSVTSRVQLIKFSKMNIIP